MRILLCNWKDLAHPAAGGAEVYTHELTRRWAASGHDVTLVCAHAPGLASQEERDGVTVIRRGGRHTVYRAARAFYENGAHAGFDVVIDEINTRPFGVPRWAGGRPVLAIIHQLAREVWFHETAAPVAVVGRYLLEPYWLRAYRDVPILTISESSRDSLRMHGLEQVVVVPPGCDVELRSGIEKDPDPTVVFLGRLSSNKRPDHALAAFADLRRVLPTARLSVIGTGPLEERLRRSRPDGVTFHGWVDHRRKLELLTRAHVLVATSVREGWNLAVDEAAACGTRTVAYDVAGLHDSVPAAGGALAPSRPEALAGVLARHLPTWVDEPARSGWRGGAIPWADCADRVLEHVAAVSRAGVSVR